MRICGDRGKQLYDLKALTGRQGPEGKLTYY